MQPGQITASGNFKLLVKIKTLDEFWAVISNSQTIYARHRVYSTAFSFSWHISTIKQWLDRGWFWTVKKIEKE